MGGVDSNDVSSCVVNDSFEYTSYGIGPTTLGKWNRIALSSPFIGFEIQGKTFGYSHDYQDDARMVIVRDGWFRIGWLKDNRNSLYYEYYKSDSPYSDIPFQITIYHK